MNHPCTKEFLKILKWEMDSLNYELIFKSDDELSTFLKTKGKILEADKMINIIEGLGKEPEEEEKKKEDSAV